MNNNKLTALDLKGHSDLEILECSNNGLTTLDISNNLRLKTLRANKNKLTALDLRGHRDLSILECSQNGVTSLDVSDSAALCGKIIQETRTTIETWATIDGEFDKIGEDVRIDIDVTITAGEHICKPAALYQKVQQVVSGCTYASMSEKEKALALHDWLTHHTYYDYSQTNEHASGVLLKGSGVCQAYSLAYRLLLREAGMASIIVGGTAGEGGSHAWNYVRVDGLWYHVDVTWDDPGQEPVPVSGGEHHHYFLMTTAQISQDHVPHTNLSGYPEGPELPRIDPEDNMESEPEDDVPVVFTVSGVKLTQVKGSRTVVVTGPDDTAPLSEINIPSVYTADDGTVYKVTKIAKNAFRNQTELTKVTIGKNVNTIGKGAFSGCTTLRKVSGGAGVVTIGADAFRKCTALTSFTIEKKVKKIGANAFNGCKKLSKITVKPTKLTMGSVGKNAFKDISKKAAFKCPKKQKETYAGIFRKKGAPKTAKYK